ncbi:MAG: response regulator [Limisphaerales bacterium]
MKRGGVIFLIENSTEYLFLLDQDFRRSQIYNPLRVARYGNEAILYLKGVGIYSDRAHYPLPELIIIDLALPDGSGLAVLGWIRRQAEFDHVPVIILVEPDQRRTIQEAFDRGASAYYLKRDDFDGLARMVRSLGTVADRKAVNSGQRYSAEELQAS